MNLERGLLHLGAISTIPVKSVVSLLRSGTGVVHPASVPDLVCVELIG